MLNKVVLMGRIVADPELKTTGTGISVTTFRIAVERSYAKQGEERKTDFFDVVCWRNSAEFVCRYFGKGSMIAVEGQLQSRTYQTKDGSNRYVVEVVADSVSFTGERRDNSNINRQNNGYQRNNSYRQNNGYQKNNSYQQSNVNQQNNDYPQNNGNQVDDIGIDDDLPF